MDSAATVPFPPPDLPRSRQPCDSCCAYYEVLAAVPDWGWCHDPRGGFRQGLVRPGRERTCYACRPDPA